MNNYEQGFIEKCIEFNVNPNELIKLSMGDTKALSNAVKTVKTKTIVPPATLNAKGTMGSLGSGTESDYNTIMANLAK